MTTVPHTPTCKTLKASITGLITELRVEVARCMSHGTLDKQAKWPIIRTGYVGRRGIRKE